MLTDVDMLIIERGLGGGISMISKRYGKVNNKYMGEDLDSTKRSWKTVCFSEQIMS